MDSNITKLTPISQGTIKVVKEGHSPYIGDNGNWFVYDDTQKKSVDTGIKAQGPEGIPGEKGVNGITGQVFYWVTPDDKDGPLSIMYDAFHELYQNEDNPPLSPYLFLICKEDGIYSWGTKFNRECKALDVLIMLISDCERYSQVEYGYSLKGEDGKGAVSDWAQTDENADDFIKNKPFWDNSEIITFPNADYDNPYIENEGMPVYQICEGVPFKSLDEFDGLRFNYHYKGEPYNRSITLVKGVNVDIFEEVSTIVAPGIQCLLNPLEFDESTTIPSGIYAFPDEDGNVTVIDSFVRPNIKKLEDKYIPDSVMTNDVTLYFENASYLFKNNIFKKPPFVLLSNRIDGLFYDCINLEECTINPNGLENLRACENAFYYCKKLKKIFGVLDFEYCTYIGNPFAYCYELSYIEKIVKINQDISFCHCNKLDPSTVTKILKALVESSKNHTLTLPSNIVLGLTAEQWALVPDNWVVG